ncbi:MAG: hypothetical protein J5956_12690, partial [Ruminococcus sp.]|nr:hypothetical protein [Ruminococcus sp.]
KGLAGQGQSPLKCEAFLRCSADSEISYRQAHGKGREQPNSKLFARKQSGGLFWNEVYHGCAVLSPEREGFPLPRGNVGCLKPPAKRRLEYQMYFP